MYVVPKACSVVHVGGRVDSGGELFDLHLESLLDFLENFFVLVGGGESDGQTLGSETTGTTDAMQVRVSIPGHVKVEHNVDFLDVDSATENLSGNQNAVLELLEAVINLDSEIINKRARFELKSKASNYTRKSLNLPFLLREVRVDSLRGQEVLVEHFSQFDGVLDRAYKNYDLIELQLINQTHQLGNLFLLVQGDVVLSEPVQSQLAFVFNEHFGGVAHKLTARVSDFARQRRSEHEHLLVVRSHLENLLNVRAHGHVVKHLVALVQNEHLQVVQRQSLVADQSQDTSGRTHYNVRSLVTLEQLLLHSDGLASVDHLSSHVGHELGKTSEFALDLVSKLTSVAHDQGRARVGVLAQALQHVQHKDGSFAHSRHSLAEHIHTEDSLRNALLLHVGGVFETAVNDGLLEFRLEEHVLERGGVNANVASRLGGSAVFVAGIFTSLFFEYVVVVVGEFSSLLVCFNHFI